MKRNLLLVFLLFIIWLSWGIITDSIEPVMSTDISLMQMNDTTEGHLANRIYQNNRSLLYSPIIPFGISVVLIMVFLTKKSKE